MHILKQNCQIPGLGHDLITPHPPGSMHEPDLEIINITILTKVM